MANAFKTQRVAFANFVPTTAATYASDAILPKGAIVTALRAVEGTVLASGTNITFKAGSKALTAAISLSAFTGVDLHAITNADGLAVTADGALSITSVGTHTGDIDVYVEYYFAEDHT